MFQNPTLFPQISNRETWLQIVQLADNDTRQLIQLNDDSGNPAYDVELEIIEASPRAGIMGYAPSPWYDWDCAPIISASLDNYISIIDIGTLQIQIPKSVIRSLVAKTYDVFMTISPIGEDDGRQIWIGRLPVLYGGRNT